MIRSKLSLPEMLKQQAEQTKDASKDQGDQSSKDKEAEKKNK